MRNGKRFHDYEKEKGGLNSFASFLLCVEVLIIVLCFLLAFTDYDDVEVLKYNEAARKFNELSLEQRQMFGEVLFKGEKKPSYFDSQTYTFVIKKCITLTDALWAAFVNLLWASGFFFMIYCFYCLLHRFYLADFPFKGVYRTLLLPIFLLVGGLFFLVSYLRMQKAKANLVHQK